MMWEHYCLTEQTTMEVGKGEECNWCGKEEEEELMKADGFEEALIGRGQQFNSDFYVYSYTKCIQLLMEEGMTDEEAVEYFEYNIQGAWVGKGTPIFLYDERWSEWNENK